MSMKRPLAIALPWPRSPPSAAPKVQDGGGTGGSSGSGGSGGSTGGRGGSTGGSSGSGGSTGGSNASGGSGGSSTGGSGGTGGSSTGGTGGSGTGGTGGSAGSGGSAVVLVQEVPEASGGSGGSAADGGKMDTMGDAGGTEGGGNTGAFTFTSPDFLMISGGRLCHKKEQTSSGGQVSPGLMWSGLPPETKSIVVSLKDRNGGTHWLMCNIQPTVTSLPRDINKSMKPEGIVQHRQLVWAGRRTSTPDL